MHFRVGGKDVDLTHDAVVAAVQQVEPEPTRSHAVRVGDRVFPVKQAVAVATGFDRLDFTTVTARRVLNKLGFELMRTDASS